MRRRSKEEESPRTPAWMVTFSDMVTLILVFFILLFSMSQIDKGKFESIVDSFQGASIIPDGSTSDLDVVLKDVKAYLKEHDMEDAIKAERTDRGVVLVLQEQALFETGDAEVLDSAFPFLDMVAGLLEELPNKVDVEGHTDNRPISTYRYPSNWELSTARASSVIRYLVNETGLDPERFIAIGYGDTMPVEPNDSDAHMQKNRRVEIIVTDPAYKEK